MTNKEYWTKWIKAAAIRALRTMAETALAYIGSAKLFGDVNWQGVLSAAIMGGIVSVLLAVAGLPEVDPAAKIGMQPEDLGDEER